MYLQVKLIRTMRDENERFRKWKLQNEKKIVKLCNQDRKMQSAIVKMENTHAKQQNVLKRRVEEAVATNKRLKVLYIIRCIENNILYMSVLD